LIAPYEERDGWDLNVMCVNGTMYFEEHISDAKLAERYACANFACECCPRRCFRNNMQPRHRLQTYYGYAFESYCTSSVPDRAVPGWGGDVDTDIQWWSVVKTKLGDTRMIMGGEVDCVRGIHMPLLSRRSFDGSQEPTLVTLIILWS
jgi:RAT1-interacting protein